MKMPFFNRAKSKRSPRHLLHRGYLIIGLLLSVAAYLVSLWLFPEWAQSWKLLIILAVAIIAGVFAFIANWRQAVEPTPLSGHQDYQGKIEKSVGEFELRPLPPPRSRANIFIDRGPIVIELLEKLRNHQQAAIVGVSGMGGVGKTELAIHCSFIGILFG